MKSSSQKKPVYNPFETLENRDKPKIPVIPKAHSLPTTPENMKKMKDFSPMDLEKLNKAYTNQDQKSLEELRKNMTPEQIKEQEKQRFFKNYKQKEEEYFLQRKREEEEKKRQEEEAEFQKKRQEEQKRIKLLEQQEEPHGKIRNFIFGKQKKISRTNPPPPTIEYKPNKGSQ